MDKSARVAIIGAGLAGLTLAGLLHRDGYNVSLFEQTPRFLRVGAGIILGPSICRVMARLGVAEQMLAAGIRPDAFVSRAWNTGDTMNELRLGPDYERRMGGALVNIHRADLHAILAAVLPAGSIHFEHRLAGVEDIEGRPRLFFDNGQIAQADIVVGADGIRSQLRQTVFEDWRVRYTGRVAHRAVFPAERAAGIPMRDCTKWWGPDRHVLAYYMTDRRDEIYVMGASPDEKLDADTPPTPCGKDAFLSAFEGFHPELLGLIDAAKDITLLPICDLERNDVWSRGNVALMGDACHAVRPFMAAGGSMAIEDAAILACCLATQETPGAAFAAYEKARIPRVAEVQRISAENTWLKRPGNTDWFFGYDPFSEKLGITA